MKLELLFENISKKLFPINISNQTHFHFGNIKICCENEFKHGLLFN